MLRTCSERHGKTIERVSPRTLRTLCTYTYPGNIRELENVIDHAITLCEGDALTEQDLPAAMLAHGETAAAAAEPEQPAAPVFIDGGNLDEQLATYEKDMLLAALDRAGGVRKRAAELLGIKYRSLRHRLSKYGLASADDDDLDLGPSALN
jgi:two-component system response regulator PilR (NtrC family)